MFDLGGTALLVTAHEELGGQRSLRSDEPHLTIEGDSTVIDPSKVGDEQLLEPMPPAAFLPQGQDGQPHITYYRRDQHLSYVWDGIADHVLVSQGGYAEPVVETIPAPSPITIDSVGSILQRFAARCDQHADRWSS